MKNLTFVLIMFFVMVSCQKDELDGSETEVTPIDDQIEFELTEFVWKKMINRAGLPKNFDSFYPLIYEGKVIFSNWELAGFIAMDLENGETVWDNRGSTNDEYLSARPIKVKNKIYTIKTSGLRVINLDDGTIEVGYLWPVRNEFLDNQFNIDENTLYAEVHEYATAVTFSGWASCPIDRLAEQEWTYFDRQFMINNNGFQRYQGAPVFYQNAADEKLMIYQSLYANLGFSDEYNRIEAYNLDRNEMEWSNENGSGGSLLLPLMEDNKIYYAENKSVHCVDAVTGKTLWQTPEGVLGEINSGEGIVPHDDMLIVPTKAGSTLALDKENGSVIWEQQFQGWEAELYHSGSKSFTAQIYNDRLYYINGWGRLISVDTKDGTYRVYKLPRHEIDEELKLDLFEQSLTGSHLVISEDGIIYTADGIRFLAFEVPDK